MINFHKATLQKCSSDQSSIERELNPLVVADTPKLSSFPKTIKTLWQFSRPHTLIGSTLSITSLFCYATSTEIKFTRKFVACFIGTLIPAAATNIFITGLNQITDIEIDRINKPYLPLPANNLSVSEAVAVVLTCFAIAIFGAISEPWPLQLALYPSLLLGAFYSLPPLRLKRFPLFAASSIAIVRGLLINVGFFCYAKMKLYQEPIYSFPYLLAHYPDILLVALYFTVFGLVIALLKDTPDVAGDKAHHITTFAAQHGANYMLRMGKNILIATILTLGGLLCGVKYNQWSKSKLCAVLSVLAAFVIYLQYHWKQVIAVTADASSSIPGSGEAVEDDPQRVYTFYMKIWNIFYASYLLLPWLK